MSEVVQCDACGGSVVYDAGVEAARCLFCGSVALHPLAADEPPPIPEESIDFHVDSTRADAAFRSWARSSWWYPKQLRGLEIGVAPVRIPAWRFAADVETHWAGIAPAPTRSGGRPRSGTVNGPARAMVPASLGLSEAELHRLEPFDEADVGPWATQDREIPYEVPALSERAGLSAARRIFNEDRRRATKAREGLRQCRTTSALLDVQARLMMLPIYIGSFRYRDRPWRFVINAQTGAVVGRAPLDRLKVAIAAVIVAVLVGLVVWLRSGQ